MPSLGELCALGAPACWAVALVLYRRAGATVSPASMNLFKNLLAIVLLSVTGLVMGVRVPLDRPPADWARLVVSGVLGLALADTLVFEGLRRIGAARLAVVDTVYAPLVVFLSWVFLDEQLSSLFLVGAAAVVGGIAIANIEVGAVRGPAAPGGVLYAFTGICCTALGVVVTRPVLVHESLVEVTWTRLVVGVLGQVVWLTVRREWPSVTAVFRPSPVWRTLVPAAIVGTYLSLLLWLGGFKWADASVAAVLNQMGTIYLLVLARVFLGEGLRPRQVLGALLAAAGVVFIVMSR
jgi:drug/metabolite transporter (DMT)-like permease